MNPPRSAHPPPKPSGSPEAAKARHAPLPRNPSAPLRPGPAHAADIRLPAALKISPKSPATAPLPTACSATRSNAAEPQCFSPVPTRNPATHPPAATPKPEQKAPAPSPSAPAPPSTPGKSPSPQRGKNPQQNPHPATAPESPAQRCCPAPEHLGEMLSHRKSAAKLWCVCQNDGATRRRVTELFPAKRHRFLPKFEYQVSTVMRLWLSNMNST